MEPWIIVIAGSSGAVEALRTIVAGLPASLPAAVVIVQHRTGKSRLEELLGYRANMPVKIAKDGARVDIGTIYLSRDDAHLTITAPRTFQHVDGERRRFLRSSANPLFESVADAYREHAIAVVLTGSGTDATDGVQAVSRHGGIVIAQDPASANHRGMPSSAIGTGAVTYVLPVAAIAKTLVSIVNAAGDGGPVPKTHGAASSFQ